MSAVDIYQDQNRMRADCGAPFVWSASEQESFHGLGLSNPHKRCKDCGQVKRDRRGDHR